MDNISKIKEGVAHAIKGLEILQKKADQNKDVMGMVVILGVALALQKICEGVEEIEKSAVSKVGMN